MKSYVIFNALGVIRMACQCLPGVIALQLKPDDFVMEGSANTATDMVVIDSQGTPTIKPKPVIAPVQTQAEIYETHLDLGYVDAATGIKLKTTESAQAKFAQLVTLLSVALQANAVQPTTTQEFYDFDDAAHTLPISAIIALLMRYGFFCANLFNTYAP